MKPIDLDVACITDGFPSFGLQLLRSYLRFLLADSWAAADA
jgi:hypothetical protein